MKILIVEDNDSVRESMADVLTLDGHYILTAVTGTQALERLEREGPVDVIITDLMLPTMNGNRLIDELKKLPTPPPVVVLSGMADLPAIEPPIVACFRKPAPPEELLALLATLKVSEVLEEDSPFPPLPK